MFNNKLFALLVASMLWLATFAYAETVSLSWGDLSVWDSTSSVSISWDETDLSLDDLEADLMETESSSSVSSLASSAWWGYTATDSVQVVETTADTATLSTPVIKDWNGSDVKIYKVVTSDKSIKDSDPLSMKETTFTFEQITWTTLNLVLTGLNPASTYYFLVTPMKDDGVTKVSWDVSAELSFTTQAHAAAPTVDLMSANISYTYTWNKVVLTWSPVAWADKLEVFLAWEWDKDKLKMGEVAASAWTFEFEVTKAWSYNVTLIPVNNDWTSVWAEYVQKVDVVEVAAKEVVAPKVWPATDMLIAIMILASIGYVVFRFRRS